MLNKLSFNLMNELNESETSTYKIKKKVFTENTYLNESSINKKGLHKPLKEYYTLGDNEHIIWDSEMNYYDEEIMNDAKANQYQDYLDSLEDGEEPREFEDWYEDYINDSAYDDSELLYEDLKLNVLPEIDKQLNDNVLLLSGGYNSNYPDFRSSGSGGLIWYDGTKGFKDYIGGFDRVAITTSNGVLGAVCADHDGTVAGSFYTLPADKTELMKALGYEEEGRKVFDEYDDYGNLHIANYDSVEEFLKDFMPKQFEEDLYYENLDVRDLNEHIDLLVPVKDTISGYTEVQESDCNKEIEDKEIKDKEILNEKPLEESAPGTDAYDKLVAGDDIFFRNDEGIALLGHYADNYPEPEEYNEGYKPENGGTEEGLRKAKEAAANRDVWEFMEVFEDTLQPMNEIYAYVYGQDELMDMLKTLRQVEVIKKLEESESDELKGKDVLYVFETFDTGVDKNQENLIKFANDKLNLGLDPVKDDSKIALEIQKLTGKEVEKMIKECYGDEIANKFEEELDKSLETLDTSKIKYIEENKLDDVRKDSIEKGLLSEADFEIDYAPDGIDLSTEENIIRSLKKWLGKLANEVNIEVEELSGPGGGYPVVKLSGDKEKIAQFLLKNYNSGEDSLEDVYDMYLINEAEKPLKEAYSERYGGDPEDFINDVESIKQVLLNIDTSKFGARLAEEMVEHFIETCDSQIDMVKGKLETEPSMKESEKDSYTDEDEAEYYRNKELYKHSNLARHREAMEKAKKACEEKGIKLDESEIKEDTEEFLDTRYDPRKSFYKKARVVTKDNGDEELYSYDTHVGGIRGGKPYSKGKFSQTTTRHQKEFFRQRGHELKDVPVEECDSNKIEEAEVTNLKMIKNQGNIYMLEDDNKQIIVGENYNEAENIIENAEIYESKEAADKDYLDRCEITGGSVKTEEIEEGVISDIKANHCMNKAYKEFNKGNKDKAFKELNKAKEISKKSKKK